MPIAHAIDEVAQKLPHPSPCAQRGGIAVPPHKGDALLFHDMNHLMAEDRATLHASCPTLKASAVL
jgi:hypothetical protein